MGRWWNADPTKLNCFSGHSAGTMMLYIRGDGNSLTLSWESASGQSRSCFFQCKAGAVLWQVAALLGHRVPCSGFVFEEVFLPVCTHLAQEAQGKRERGWKYFCLPECYFHILVFPVIGGNAAYVRGTPGNGLCRVNGSCYSWSFPTFLRKILFWKILLDFWSTF